MLCVTAQAQQHTYYSAGLAFSAAIPNASYSYGVLLIRGKSSSRSISFDHYIDGSTGSTTTVYRSMHYTTGIGLTQKNGQRRPSGLEVSAGLTPFGGSHYIDLQSSKWQHRRDKLQLFYVSASNIIPFDNAVGYCNFRAAYIFSYAPFRRVGILVLPFYQYSLYLHARPEGEISNRAGVQLYIRAWSKTF